MRQVVWLLLNEMLRERNTEQLMKTYKFRDICHFKLVMSLAVCLCLSNNDSRKHLATVKTLITCHVYINHENWNRLRKINVTSSVNPFYVVQSVTEVSILKSSEPRASFLLNWHGLALINSGHSYSSEALPRTFSAGYELQSLARCATVSSEMEWP